jgi:hypothetical protein
MWNLSPTTQARCRSTQSCEALAAKAGVLDVFRSLRAVEFEDVQIFVLSLTILPTSHSISFAVASKGVSAARWLFSRLSSIPFAYKL